jgi:tetratricopeptide (TPR) repeat protein
VRFRRGLRWSFVAFLSWLAPAHAIAQPQAQPQPPPRAPDAPVVGNLASGLEALRISDYPAAERALLAVRGADAAAAALALARVMREEGRYAEAERFATQAMSSASQRLVATALRAEILGLTGKVDEAIRFLEPNKDAPGLGGRRVRLALGELLLRAGRRVDAEPVLLKFAEEYGNDAIAQGDAEGLAMVGRAMHLLRHPKDANRAFKESEKAEIAASGGALHASAKVETLLWFAELFLDNYDTRNAGELLEEALKIAPHNADAMVLFARAHIDDAYDFDAADKLVNDALATNPKHTGAFAVRAGMHLRDMDIDGANAAIDAGLAIDSSDLELLSLRAAARFLADDKSGYEAAKSAIFSRNKEYSRAFGIIGDFAEWEHRYDDVIAMMKEAVTLDPKDSKAWAQLGQMQTRAGDEAEGVKSLEQAWKGDHFNVRAFNTLEKLYGHWIPEQYDSGQEDIFKIRYPKGERAILERYVPRFLGEAWGTMKLHYMFAPATPVAVELYEDRKHFAVRTSGLPNIGIDGVCFGHVVAAMSPRGDAVNWGNVVWHELAHVFAIQLSKSHVPRWFTEGLSEYETSIRRPEWQRELDPELYVALKQNRLPSALDMNKAFTHSTEEDVEVAYYASSQMLAFTADQFGFAGITRALQLWGEGKRTADVLRGAFGISPADYDARFRAWEAARLARYEGQYIEPRPKPVDEARALLDAAPKSASAHAAFARALLRVHKQDDAAREVDAALKLDPNDPDAHFMAARVAATAKDAEGAEKHLRAIKAARHDGYTVEMKLGELAEARHDAAAERAALEAAHRFDPSQVDAVHALFDLATAEKRAADALGELREWARLDQHDRDGEWKALLTKLVEAKSWAEAKSIGEAAIYVDIENAGVHMDYARALSATGDHPTAAFELESALLCESKPPEKATAHALLARERLALGDAAGARAHRDEALKLDPDNAEAKALRL